MKKDRRATGLFVSCACGSKASVVETGWGYYCHCLHCGRLSFFKSDAVLEKIKLGGPLCSHAPELKPCKGGQTSWCNLCRIRTFLPTGGKES